MPPSKGIRTPPACRIICEVTVIDKEKATAVSRKLFEGSSSPDEIPIPDGSGHGSRPTEKIVEYITSLPRQAR
jgi:hypothetical protein